MTAISSGNCRVLSSLEGWTGDLRILNSICDSLSVEAFVVGGVVRDLLAGNTDSIVDVDIVVTGRLQQVVELFCKSQDLSTPRISRFLTSTIILKNSGRLDLAQTRKETYSVGGALPEVRPGTLEEDALRRDFTVNALYIKSSRLTELLETASDQEGGAFEDSFAKDVIDLVGGKHHLETGCLEILHSESFRDDPTRIFRAARYYGSLASSRYSGVAHLGPLLSSELGEALGRDVLSDISHFRKLTELKRCISHPTAPLAMNFLINKGVLDKWPCKEEQAVAVFKQRWDFLCGHLDSLESETVYQSLMMSLLELAGGDNKRSLLADMKIKKKRRVELERIISGDIPGESDAELLFLDLQRKFPQRK